MNKHLYHGILLSIVLLTGCAVLDTEDQFYEKKVSDTTLHTITPIEPNQFTVAPKPTPTLQTTVNEPNLPVPPAELKMSIEECRALSLKNNLDLQAKLIDPAIATASLRSSQAAYESVFSIGTSFSADDRPNSTAALGSGYVSTSGSQSHNIYSSTGVQVPLRTGGELNFGLADNRIHQMGSAADFNNSFQFSFSQPLLKGAGQRNRITNSIRLTQYEKQITDNATKLEVIKTLVSADKVYWQLYAARKELEVRQKQHELAIAQLERAKRMVDAGQSAKVEIVRAEAGVSRQLAAIITAENNLRTKQRDFKKNMNKPGLDIETPTIMIPTTEANPVHYQFDTQKLIDQALDNRTEMLDMELQIAKSILDIDYKNNQMLPDLAMKYGYTAHGTGISRNDSFDMLNQKRFEGHQVDVTLSFPLGNEAAKNELIKAMYQKRQQLATKAGRRQMIKQEVLDDVDSVETNWQQILASRQSAILEGQLYETEIRQFEVGLRTSTDVLDAQSKFADAQSSEITALVNYEISLVDLAYDSGTILGADKIIWEPIVPPTPVN